MDSKIRSIIWRKSRTKRWYFCWGWNGWKLVPFSLYPFHPFPPVAYHFVHFLLMTLLLLLFLILIYSCGSIWQWHIDPISDWNSNSRVFGFSRCVESVASVPVLYLGHCTPDCYRFIYCLYFRFRFVWHCHTVLSPSSTALENV